MALKEVELRVNGPGEKMLSSIRMNSLFKLKRSFANESDWDKRTSSIEMKFSKLGRQLILKISDRKWSQKSTGYAPEISNMMKFLEEIFKDVLLCKLIITVDMGESVNPIINISAYRKNTTHILGESFYESTYGEVTTKVEFYIN